MLVEGSDYVAVRVLEQRQVLLSRHGHPLVSRELAQPVHSLRVCSRLVQVLAVFKALVLFAYERFQRLGAFDPLEDSKPVGHRHDGERLQIKRAILTRRIFLENSIHDAEELLYALV